MSRGSKALVNWITGLEFSVFACLSDTTMTWDSITESPPLKDVAFTLLDTLVTAVTADMSIKKKVHSQQSHIAHHMCPPVVAASLLLLTRGHHSSLSWPSPSLLVSLSKGVRGLHRSNWR